jgi:hypothetical protein
MKRVKPQAAPGSAHAATLSGPPRPQRSPRPRGPQNPRPRARGGRVSSGPPRAPDNGNGHTASPRPSLSMGPARRSSIGLVNPVEAISNELQGIDFTRSTIWTPSPFDMGVFPISRRGSLITNGEPGRADDTPAGRIGGVGLTPWVPPLEWRQQGTRNSHPSSSFGRRGQGGRGGSGSGLSQSPRQLRNIQSEPGLCGQREDPSLAERSNSHQNSRNSRNYSPGARSFEEQL